MKTWLKNKGTISHKFLLSRDGSFPNIFITCRFVISILLNIRYLVILILHSLL